MKTMIAVAALAVVFPLAAQGHEKAGEGNQGEGHDVWFADFDVAAKQAAKEHKDLLVDFTGSDWCGWCIKLHDEVFSHEEFLDGVKKDYVLVALDFPRSEEVKAKVPNPERNAELRDKYGIRGYPTVLLTTPAGEVFGQTGYEPGGPVKYVEHLHDLAAKGKADLAEVKALSASFAKAQGDDRKKVFETVVHKLTDVGGDSPLAASLADIVRKALTDESLADQKHAAVAALLGAGQVDEATSKAARALDPKNQDGLLEKVVDAMCKNVHSQEQLAPAVKAIVEIQMLGYKDKELAKGLFSNGAYWADRFLKDTESAKKLAKAALELGPDERIKPMLEKIIGG